MDSLHIDHLNKSFGEVHALRDMTFSVHPGEIYGFVGSNGAGKSTTMRIALGVLATDSGEVRVGDTPLNDSLRRRIGYMPEERGLYDKEKISDQLQFFARLHGLTPAKAKSNTENLLERLGIAERSNSKLNELSLGNQQRVQLAASLIHDPELLILDEPFSGLDPVAVAVMSDILIERARAGVPVLFSSHQLDLVQRLCHRVGVISQGRMLAEGTVDELRNRGPVRYEIHTPARDWYPAHTQLIEETQRGVVLEDTSEHGDDQAILHAALAAGPVHSFTRRVPHLTDLFREIVQTPGGQPTTQHQNTNNEQE